MGNSSRKGRAAMPGAALVTALAARARRVGLLGALLLLLCANLPGLARAQEFAGLARLDVAASGIYDDAAGLQVMLYLSQPVPYRAYTLDGPPRLVLDFREVDWRGATPVALLAATRASGLRFGTIRPGWSRMVVDLAGPYALATAGLQVDVLTGTALLEVRLAPVDLAEFIARSGAPPGVEWEIEPPPAPALPPPEADGPLMVVVDPGHGGIDPGAIRDDLTEAGLMLALGLELADAINRSGTMRAVLTRDSDIFVPLAQRMTIARAAGADVFISLHADALETAQAHGASVYTLSGAAADQASARMAERHERGDLLAGLDLSGQDDTVATVLMDLARLETAPQSLRLADAVVAGLLGAGADLNSHPRREGPLAVLNAADFPSVLIEVGFLSSDRDQVRLTSPEGRAPIVAGILAALQSWAADEAARAALNRQ